MEESNDNKNNNIINENNSNNNIRTEIEITNTKANNTATTNTSSKPTPQILNRFQTASSSIPNNQTINRNTISTYNEQLFPSSEDKLYSMHQDRNIKQTLLGENALLKKELIRLRDILNEKLIIITDFQSTFETSNLKFKQLVDKVELLQTQKANLSLQLADYQAQLYKQKLKIYELESHSKMMIQYEEHISSLRNDFSKTETQLTLKHKERENEIRNEFNNEIAKLLQQNEELKQQNEKLKYQISHQQITIDNYVNQKERSDSHLNEQLHAHHKEIKNKDDIINEYKQKLLHAETVARERKQAQESDMSQIKHEKEKLVNELNNNRNNYLHMQQKLTELSLQYESTLKQYKECKLNLETKNNVVEQLKQQIEYMNTEIAAKENQIILNDKSKIKETKDYEARLQKLIEDKQTLDQVNNELNGCLNNANNKIKELNDIINSNMKHSSHQHHCHKDNTQYLEELVCHLKQRETSLIEENTKLKDMLHTKDKEDNDKTYQIHSSHSALTNQGNSNLNYSHYNIHEYQYGINNSHCGHINRRGNVYNNDMQEEEQRKTLEDFRRLLSHIEEKLDLPEVVEGNY